MPQYAFFNHTIADPKPVIGWYDTDLLNYPKLPDPADLLSVTPMQWAARLANPSGWAVNGGALVSYTPPTPVPTLVQQAQMALSAGVAVTSGSTPALNGTYDISPAVQGRIASIATYTMINGKFPRGAATYAWADMVGGAHIFPSIASFQAFATAIADHVSDLEQIVLFGSGTLPPPSVTIP